MGMSMVKRPQGLSGLITVFIIIGIAGVFLTYRAGGQNTQQTIDNIALLQANSSYMLKDGKFVIRDGKGATCTVPLEAGTGDSASYFSDKAVYISDEVTAVAYGGTEADSSVKVLVSDDKGKTWSSTRVAEAGADHAGTKFLGFLSKRDGWLVTAGDVASGSQKNRVFLTADGGKSWSEIGNISEAYPHVVTGAGFASPTAGFLSFRYDSNPDPVVYRTQDKGKTWVKCAVGLPPELKNVHSYPTALSPVFHGASGVLPVAMTDNDTGAQTQIRYVTDDSGKTWTFDKKSLPQ
ncbi:MAG: WD40/YVTN/BNR-like repeat-containing protein [bacterium]